MSEDLKTITWKLKDGLMWSDGTPVTANDVKFTADYCMDPEGGCACLAQCVGEIELLEAALKEDASRRPLSMSFRPANPDNSSRHIRHQMSLLCWSGWSY